MSEWYVTLVVIAVIFLGLSHFVPERARRLTGTAFLLACAALGLVVVSVFSKVACR